MVNKVEIGGGDGRQGHSEVADDGNRFEKDFGENDGGTPVQIHATVMHELDQGAEKTEVVMGGCAESGAINGRVHMGDVCADGQVNRNRNFLLVGGNEYAHFRVPGLNDAARQILPGGFAVAHAH